MVTINYTTELNLNRYLGMIGDTLDRNAGDEPCKDEVGVGNDSKTVYWLNQRNIINGTDELYAATTALTRDTDYSIDYETGKITLTNAGTTALGSSILYADYKYNKFNIDNTTVNLAIARAEADVDDYVQSVFVDSSGSTPSWGEITNEEYDGQGTSDRTYFTKFAPIADINTTLSGTLSNTGTTIVVSSTDGFPSSGVILLDTEQISYSSKTGTTFIVDSRGYSDSTAGTHLPTIGVYSTIVEVSLDEEGTEPTWLTLQRDIDFDVDDESGRIYLYKEQWTTSNNSYYNNLQPLKGVPNRVRFSYLYGYDSIPANVERATIMMAARELRLQTVSRALIEGRNEFKPATIDIDLEWVKSTLDEYKTRVSKRI